MINSHYRRAAFSFAATFAAVAVIFTVCTGLFPANAQSNDPWNAADTIRRDLFDAQTSLLSGDTSGAVTKVTAATAIYTQSLKSPIAAAAPDLASGLDQAVSDALIAAQNNDPLGLSVARSTIYTAILHGSARLIVSAINKGDAATAQQWLQLRDFRTPTKFSRPDANATLALNGLVAHKVDAAQAVFDVKADLLDTYQAKLNEALINADTAQQQNFGAKEAEQVALAAGYFNIVTDQALSSVYVSAHGASGLTTSQATFATLIQAALHSDAASYKTARTAVDTALTGFRAAPLSDAEQARRAGQLSQFVTLVAVEYGRGVANGKVLNDIEVQEALTFRDGANAAFTDLQTILAGRDAKATAHVAAQLATLKTQIKSTVDPSALGNTVSDISKTLTTLYPASWQTINSGSDFDVISSILDQIEPAVKQGLYPQAESSRLQAYAILDSGIEQKLRGFAPDKALNVESLFWQGTDKQVGLSVLLTSNAPLAQVDTALKALRASLADSETFLGGEKPAPAAVIGNAAVIVFREGLEAVLILASLIASMRMDEARKYRVAIMQGALLALVAAGITWWVANGLLMSMIQYGEKLSVVVGLIAIGVLLLITNWFFHKTYWVGWMANFHKQKSKIIGGSLVVGPSVGLIILGFTSIYREGFETVLFLQSLVLDSGILTVLQGVALGLAGTVIVGLIVFVLQVRVPAKRMLVVTGILIGVVLITMVGNTVHAAQSVAWMGITPIAGLYIPYWMGQWFGLFATWQGIILQVIAGSFVIGSYVLAERIGKQRRGKPSKRESSEISVSVSGAR